MDPDESRLDTSSPAKDSTVVTTSGWNRFHKIMVIFVAGWISITLEKIVQLDSVIKGVEEGFAGGIFAAPFLLILTLPLAWVGSGIGSRVKWRRHRLWFTFGLPAIFLLLGPASALLGRSFPQERFKRITGAEFPREATVRRHIVDDGFGPFYDSAYYYELECPAEETDRLIRELRLTRNPDGMKSMGGATPRPGWVPNETWSAKGPHGIFFRLEADVTRTRLMISCVNT